MDYFLLVAGFVLLIKGADLFVDGSSSVAKRMRVPTLIIGMTIVAMGTSAPELAVSTAASLKGDNAIAISNAVGSNIFNLMVVCGACALFKPLTVKMSTLKVEFPISILAAVLLLGMGYLGMGIGRVDGAILTALFIAFLAWMVISARKARATAGEEEEIKVLPVWKCILFIVVGIAAVVWGGNLVVDSASAIALNFGLEPTLIGLTIVAFGTSLPELVTSLVAAKKGDVDMALGNVIGSNIFNILLILGVAGSLSPMSMTMENLVDIVVLIVMSVLVLIFAGVKKSINRMEGAIMLMMYAAYMVYICVR